jgi:hypothetical protein
MRRYAPIAAGALAGIIVVAGVIGIGRMTAGGQDTTAAAPTQTPSQSPAVYLWLHTSIEIPAGNSEVHVLRTFPPAPGHPFLLRVLDEETDERGNPIHEI